MAMYILLRTQARNCPHLIARIPLQKVNALSLSGHYIHLISIRMGVNSSFKLLINYSLARKVEKSSTDGLVIETKEVLPITSKTLAGSRVEGLIIINNCLFFYYSTCMQIYQS